MLEDFCNEGACTATHTMRLRCSGLHGSFNNLRFAHWFSGSFFTCIPPNSCCSPTVNTRCFHSRVLLSIFAKICPGGYAVEPLIAGGADLGCVTMHTGARDSPSSYVVTAWPGHAGELTCDGSL